MRKSASAGNLQGRLAESRSHDVVGSRHLKPTAGRKVSSEQDLCHLGSAQPAFRNSSLPANVSRGLRHVTAAAALPHFDSLPPSALAEDVLEASFARGLASAECFELYGPLKNAPLLDTGGTSDAAAAAQWSSQAAATSQQFAACLATPFTGQDQNLGEMVRSRVDQLTADQELKTQLRYAEELRMRRESEEEDEEEQEALQAQAGRQRRVRIKRRPSEEMLDAELAGLGGRPIAGGAPRFGEQPPPKYSPETCAALQTLYSSLDDDSNRLTLHNEDVLCVIEGDAADQDSGDLFLMDAAPPSKHTTVNGGKAHKRSLININASAAPALYDPSIHDGAGAK